MANPFQVGRDESLRAQPCVVVIFGATGDLTHRKLVPALYNLAVDALLPANFSLIGAARREVSDQEFRKSIRESVSAHSRRKPLNEVVWKEFEEHSYYVAVPFDDAPSYLKLKDRLDGLDQAAGVTCNRIFYFATGPEYFEVIATNLGAAGLLEENSADGVQRKARVIVEKPFGHDLDSAVHLNRALLDCMKEDQVYRIDHYLGKETVQNLLVFRFGNGIFEPIWNHKYISHVEISVSESLGVGGRAGYFDKAGILRDIVQNHALQLLCLVALEPPVAFEADSVRDEKVKVLRSIRRIKPEEVGQRAVRARYLSGFIAGDEVPGYLAEEGVDSESTTETYAAIQFEIDNWRWAGVPFFIRAGKRLPKRVTDISIHFRNVPHRLFQGEDVRAVNSNTLSFQIQPDEGIFLKVNAKPPGPKVRIQTVNMNFSYGSSFGIEPPEAYERLLLDCMRGDATLFTRDDEIEEAWEIMAPILDAWEGKSGKAQPVFGYEAGSWGPAAAEEMLVKRVGQKWRRL